MQILISVIGGAVTALTFACRALWAIGLRRASVEAIRLGTIAASATGAWRIAWDFFYRSTAIKITGSVQYGGRIDYTVDLVNKLNGKIINSAVITQTVNTAGNLKDLLHKCMVTYHVGEQPILTPSGWVTPGATRLNSVVSVYQSQALSLIHI